MKLQCKDIPDRPILLFLDGLKGWGTWYELGGVLPDHSVRRAMPEPDGFLLPDRLVLAKMRSLIRRGLVVGCACGCRGDFEITPAGRAALKEAQE